MTPLPDARAPGVFVLGMHRSGTSVMAGVLDRLGLDGGPRESMFAADEFNSDGYWEQRPLVEMHDRMLLRLGGFASAPPVRRTDVDLCLSMPDGPTLIQSLVDSLFEGSWFVKDPRHCLLLPLWRAALGDDDLAVVVLRSPDDVVRSLQRRNGYSATLALGLWERYTLDLLAGLRGRPCTVVRYEDLVRRPRVVIADIADVIERHVGPLAVDSIDHAIDLVRERPHDDARALGMHTGASRALLAVLTDIVGYHPRFVLPQPLPEQSPRMARRIALRRSTLRVVGTMVGRDAVARSHLDRRRPTTARSLGNAPTS
jgi:hypothetical protein